MKRSRRCVPWCLPQRADGRHGAGVDGVESKLLASLYAYVWRQGYDLHQAEDLTREFFSRLLAKNYLADVEIWHLFDTFAKTS